MNNEVLLVSDISDASLVELLSRYCLKLTIQEDGSDIEGSFWGDTEAGIVGDEVFVRRDTPIHSLLHETCHIICMAADRLRGLDRNAGSDDLEESAVCYLQVLLADSIKGVGRDRLMQDMDTWGYSFRLGKTRLWFQHDAEDAVDFLSNHGLLNEFREPTFRLRA